MENKKNDTTDRELAITRLFDAPVALVWEAWTRPEHIAQWWGPNGFTNTIHQMDLRPGGEWDLTMHGPDGMDYKNKSIFKEIIPNKKLVYEHLTGPKFIATILFEERGDQTFLTWRMVFESAEEYIRTVKTFRADGGLRQNVDKLAVYVRGMNK